MSDFDLDTIAERHRQIGAVLLHDWDPIGVAAEPKAREEYSSYIWGTYEVAMKTRSASDVAQYLSRIETERMGMSGRNPQYLLPVGQKIVDLVEGLYDPNIR